MVNSDRVAVKSPECELVVESKVEEVNLPDALAVFLHKRCLGMGAARFRKHYSVMFTCSVYREQEHG